MADDRKKTLKEESGDRLEKAKGRLQQSFPEIQQRIRTSNAVDVARKIIDPAQSLFRQFADDIQLKDLIAKAEALVANANLTFTKAVSKESPATETFRDETPSNESSRKAGVKKTPSKGARLKKAAPKKTLSKKKKKPAPKRKPKTRS
ncbi:MAG TPA: hypothetical protein VFN63_06010 [Pseudolabrys sp.]|nr:hypothetical protein [Pseudolabrys sp.]